MKKKLHPEMFEIKSKCQTCSFEHTMKSTVKKISIDTCSNCHPFYTGNAQSIKSAGRVERFNKMFDKKNEK